MKIFLILVTTLISFNAIANHPLNTNQKGWLIGGIILGGVATATTGAFLYGNKPRLGYALLGIGGTITLTGALLNIQGNGCKKPKKF